MAQKKSRLTEAEREACFQRMIEAAKRPVASPSADVAREAAWAYRNEK